MERRTKLLILIVIALILLAIGLYILLKPFLPKTVEQPPALPSGTTPSGIVAPGTGGGTQVPTVPAAPVKAQDIKDLEDLASVFVQRIGSGSSSDGFQGYADVALNATVPYRETLKRDQAAMQAAHPAAGPAYGVTTRVVSVDSRSAVSGSDRIMMTLQAQKAEDAGSPTAPTQVSYAEVDVTFARQADGTYLVEDVVWKDLAL
ncbi:hypothetical protein L0Y59_01460 [Candidatus Uhrbacteria bacterium]|nr:hypothetical protein [Candidatus Uhrbacteria bacterium]